YHLQDLAGRSLLIQGLSDLRVRLRQRLVPFLQRGEEPDILDGDDGLIREGLQQDDLRVRERRYCLPAHGDGADRFAISEHGHRQDGAKSQRYENALLEVRIGPDIRYVNY